MKHSDVQQPADQSRGAHSLQILGEFLCLAEMVVGSWKKIIYEDLTTGLCMCERSESGVCKNGKSDPIF